MQYRVLIFAWTLFGIRPRYQAQVTLLTTLLRPIYSPELEIGTVDGMQGREKDAVIITLVRSNDQVRLRPIVSFPLINSPIPFSTARSRISQGQTEAKR